MNMSEKKFVIGCFLVLLSIMIWRKWYDAQHANPQDSYDVATQITAIRELNEWEFLCVDMEVLEDTAFSKFITYNRLACIYSGRARLGMDMKRCPKDWIRSSNDTVYVALPEMRLLDENIIDDLSTRTFYAHGEFSASVKRDLLERARRDMRARAMRPENMESARENAEQYFSAMFQRMGRKVVFK